MAGSLITLLKIEFMNRFRLQTFLHEKDTRKKYRNIAIYASFLLLVIVMGVYCYGLSYGYGALGMSSVIPGYALTITSIIIFAFTFIKTNGILFGTRDYDMLMSLPIRAEAVITAKFMSMYINNLALAMVVMIPMSVGYFMWNPLKVVTIVMWGVGTLLAPLFPMTVAAVLGMLIAFLGAGFKHKAFAQLVLTVLLMVGIFGFSYWMQKNAMQDRELLMAMLTDIGAAISRIIHKIYPLSAWFDGAVNGMHIVGLALFVAVSLIVYGIFAYVCGKSYRRINCALQNHHTASGYKMTRLKQSSALMAIVRKESRRFFSSSLYMMNMGMGLVMALLLAVVSLFAGIDTVLGGMDISGIEQIKPLISNIIPFVIAMLVNMCNTCAVSLSLEGRNLWVVNSLPIERRTLLNGKMLFNIVLVMPVSIICSLIFILEFRVNIIKALMYLLFAAASVSFSTVWGMFINIHFPNYQWENEAEVIKQGMASMIAIFSAMIGYLAMAAAAFFLSSVIAGEVVLFMASLILGVAAFVIYKLCR